MVILGQKPSSLSSKGAWNCHVLSPGRVLEGQELSQRLGRRAFQVGITWEETKGHKWPHDHSGLVLWPPRRLGEIHEYLGLSRLAHETLSASEELSSKPAACPKCWRTLIPALGSPGALPTAPRLHPAGLGG